MDFDLFIKYFAGKADPEEAMLIEEWAAASQEQHAYFQHLYASWLAAGEEVYQIPDIREEWETFKQKTVPEPATAQFVPKKTSWITKVAAAVAIVLVTITGYLVFNQNNSTKSMTADARNSNQELKLIDGTQITLYRGGRLTYPATFRKKGREVKLEGDALFDVAHKTDQPFSIALNDLHINVIGTAFLVTQRPDMVSVKVTRGKVAFCNKADTIYVTTGQTGKYIRFDQRFVLEEQSAPLTGTFHFNNTPLKNVAAELSAYFKVNVHLQSKPLNNCKLSAGFKQQGLKEILTAITETFNLNYTIDNTNIYINGMGCE